MSLVGTKYLGLKVSLKSGGPVMTVMKAIGDGSGLSCEPQAECVTCRWFDNSGNIRSDNFLILELEIME